MWKILLYMVFVASLADSADIACQWSGEVCKVTSITPVTQPNEILTVAGKPANYINTATSYINLYTMKPNLSFIPTNIFSIFQSLNYFATSSSAPKTTLVTDAFTNCNFLTLMAIQDANISNVPEGFAQTCTKITTLQLINAGIETIDKNAFKGLINLGELNMKYNKISCLPPDLFQTVPLLGVLSLEGNKINALDNGLFRNLPKLNYIHLGDNLITYMPTLNFTGSAKIFPFTLYVPRNPIIAFKSDFCNLFDSRPTNFIDYFDVPNVKCFLVNDAQTQGIKKSNCRTAMAVHLQNCYANWTLAMDAPVICGTTCSWIALWLQFYEFLKTQTQF